MTDHIWPFTINGRQFQQPKLTGKEYKIHNTNLITVIEKHPQIWNHMVTNEHKLSIDLKNYIHHIAEPFIQKIPNKSLVKIILPETEWQEQKRNQYAVMEFTHCANFNNHLLPFHDPHTQYCCFFIDIETSIQTEKLTFYWNKDRETDGTYEEHVWTCEDNIEVLYAPNNDNDEKDMENAVLKMYLAYMKGLANDRLDEIQGSSDEIIKIMMIRLRGKVRIGKHGNIVSVKAILSESQRDTIEDKISEIVDEDLEYKQSGVSYKLSRSQFFGKMQINPIFAIRIFDEFGKEMKIQNSFKKCLLYEETANGYRNSRDTLLSKIVKKFKKPKRIPKSINAMNGSRFTFNGNKIKISTNIFQSTIKTDEIDTSTDTYPIQETLGRKRNCW
eukprot:501499_1